MTYAWRIDKDHLYTEEDSFTPNEAGIQGPRDASEELLSALASGQGMTFKMYDDDDILYYTGRIVGDYEGDEPLSDFGMPNAGCVKIIYPLDRSLDCS